MLHDSRAQLGEPFNGKAALCVDVESFTPDTAELVRDLDVHGELHPELGLAYTRRAANLVRWGGGGDGGGGGCGGCSGCLWFVDAVVLSEFEARPRCGVRTLPVTRTRDMLIARD